MGVPGTRRVQADLPRTSYLHLGLPGARTVRASNVKCPGERKCGNGFHYTAKPLQGDPRVIPTRTFQNSAHGVLRDLRKVSARHPRIWACSGPKLSFLVVLGTRRVQADLPRTPYLHLGLPDARTVRASHASAPVGENTEMDFITQLNDCKVTPD